MGERETGRVTGWGEPEEFADAAAPFMGESLVGCTRQRPEEPWQFGREDFLQSVADRFGTTPAVAASLSQQVLSVVRRHVDNQELWELESQLPQDLRSFFGRSAHPR